MQPLVRPIWMDKLNIQDVIRLGPGKGYNQVSIVQLPRKFGIILRSEYPTPFVEIPLADLSLIIVSRLGSIVFYQTARSPLHLNSERDAISGKD